MRRLIINVFRAVYALTKARTFSFVIAVAYITVLNAIIIEGLCRLLDVVSPSMIHKIFSLPYALAVLSLLYTVTLLFALPVPDTTIGKKKKGRQVVIYTLVCLMLLIYDFALK